MNDNMKYINIEDEELINQVKNGDKNALEYLISKYKEMVESKVNKYFKI